MADGALLVFIVFLIAANLASLWWLWLKPHTPKRAVVMLVNVALVAVMVLGLWLQDGAVAVFYR